MDCHFWQENKVSNISFSSHWKLYQNYTFIEYNDNAVWFPSASYDIAISEWGYKTAVELNLELTNT